MNFKESVMSEAPNDLPTRTRVLVKDLLFQEKHALTDTQIDIMSYIFNAFSWAIKINGYIVLTTNKFIEDMPQIGEKTLEASIKELEYKGLISKTIVQVPRWRNARVRGIKISVKGMEYNNSLYAPTHQAIIDAFQQTIADLREQLEQKDRQLTLGAETLTPVSAPITPTLTPTTSPILPPTTPVSTPIQSPKEEIPTAIKSEVKAVVSEPKATISEPKAVVSKPKATIFEPKSPLTSECFENFVRKIRNRFILTSEPLCNLVEGWQKETIFYINSYGKLSVITPNKDFKQLENPIQINTFWKWLFQNQNRVGELIDLEIINRQITELNQEYKDKEIILNGKIRWIDEIVSINEGVAVKVRNEKGEVAIVMNRLKEPLIYDYKGLERFIDKIRVGHSELNA